MIPEAIADIITKRFGAVGAFEASTGGCINEAGTVYMRDGKFFLKWNLRQRYPLMMRKESAGLLLLRGTKAVRVPEVVEVGETDDYQFLLMEAIEFGKRKPDFWEKLGVVLAQLHQTTQQGFGLDHDNFIGSLPQSNNPRKRWLDFFSECRIRPQVRMAFDAGLIEKKLVTETDALLVKAPDILSDCQPSLLHGDLWSGNLLVDSAGSPCLVDPAVYFGNREVDLAMTQLFGGFDDRFLAAYNAAWPLAPGFSERFDIYNLYPILVHINLFGGAYVSQFRSMLRKFI